MDHTTNNLDRDAANAKCKGCWGECEKCPLDKLREQEALARRSAAPVQNDSHIETLLAAHATAAVAVHEHGAVGGFYTDLLDAQSDIRAALSAVEATKGQRAAHDDATLSRTYLKAINHTAGLRAVYDLAATHKAVAEPVAKKWAIYYDNLGEQQYTSSFMNDWKLYRSKEAADLQISHWGAGKEKHYRPVEVYIYAAPVTAAPAAPTADQQKNDVIVDRRDLFDAIRNAWREGQSGGDTTGPTDTAENWHAATEYADGVVRGWSTLRPANLAAPTAAEVPSEPLCTMRSAFDAIDFVEANNGPGRAHHALSLLKRVTPIAQQADRAEDQQDAPKLAHGHRDDYLLMANARRLAATSVRAIMSTTNWHFAAQLFATGSNSAHQICMDAGIDPYGYTVDRAALSSQKGAQKND